MSHDRRIVHSSEDPNWQTPRELWQPLDRHFLFGLDAAADATSCLTYDFLGPGSPLGTNALLVDWKQLIDERAFQHEQHTAIWLNPPYSKKKYAETKDPAYQIQTWAQKCYGEARDGCTIVGLFPFTPQTDWFRRWVHGHVIDGDPSWDPKQGWTHMTWSGFAADQVWQLPRRVSFVRAGTGEKEGNAGVNHCVIVWRPNPGWCGPWQPAYRYWNWED